MALDLLIAGGTLIDGTGGDRFTADVGIQDGVIVEIGKITSDSKRTINAAGAIVTPGFIDLHTHYDGQASWDPDLAPSCNHGVTTAVVGNCGVGFAPVRADHHDRLIELMEGVEDIPGSALAQGLTWDWETYPQYLNALDSFGHAIDIAGLVPHDCVRVFVMGERAFAGSDATEDDIKKMRAIIHEAMKQGAVGFSTGRSDNHRTAIGDFTPASEATLAELVGLSGAFHGLGHRVLQAVSDFDYHKGADEFDREFDLIEQMIVKGRPTRSSISLLQRDGVPDQYKRILSRVEAIRATGHPMHVQVSPRPIGVLLGLQATFHPFMGFPSFKEVSHLPHDELVIALRDPSRKARILKEKSDPVAGDGSALPRLADDLLKMLHVVSGRMFRLSDPPEYEPKVEDSLLYEAKRTQRPVLEVIYDALLEQNGKALIYFPLLNYTSGDLSSVHTMLSHEAALPGLSDGGAHVGTVCDGSFPTTLLTLWGRDRATGRFPLEHLVHLQTAANADFLGFNDRGRLRVGLKADLNVIDFDNLRLHPPRLYHDLPGGGRRLLQAATGYLATVLSGQVVSENDTLTAVRPGRVVRAGD